MLSRPNNRKIWLLSLLTLGLYFYYWCSHSRADINRAAKRNVVPSCWYFAVPGLNYYWMWLYAEALQQVSYKRIKRTDVFLVYVIATSFVSLPVTVARSINLSTSSTSGSVHLSLQTVLTIAGIVIFIATLINAASLAFFCTYTQGKVNALPRNSRI